MRRTSTVLLVCIISITAIGLIDKLFNYELIEELKDYATIIIALLAIYFSSLTNENNSVYQNKTLRNLNDQLNKLDKSNRILTSTLNESFRPYIVCRVYSLNHYFHFVISNDGNRNAYDVKVDIKNQDEVLNKIKEHISDKKLVDASGKALFEIQHVSLYPVSFKMDTVIFPTIDIAKVKTDKKIDDLTLSISVEYNDKNKRSYKDNYIINLANYIIPEKTAEFDIQHVLGKINSTLENIKTSIQNIKH